MDLKELRANIFTAVTFSNLITAKVVGLSWLTWFETSTILIMYMILSKALETILTKDNTSTTEEDPED